MTPRRKRGNSEGPNPPPGRRPVPDKPARHRRGRRQRPAKLAEALALADMFGVRLDHLVYDNPDAKIDQERVDAALAAINRVSDFCHDEWARLRDVKLKMLGEDEDPERG